MFTPQIKNKKQKNTLRKFQVCTNSTQSLQRVCSHCYAAICYNRGESRPRPSSPRGFERPPFDRVQRPISKLREERKGLEDRPFVALSRACGGYLWDGGGKEGNESETRRTKSWIRRAYAVRMWYSFGIVWFAHAQRCTFRV